MYWQVGIKIGQERGQVTVHPQTLQDNEYTSAVEYVMEMAQARLTITTAALTLCYLTMNAGI
jgi:hypothetical protein